MAMSAPRAEQTLTQVLAAAPLRAVPRLSRCRPGVPLAARGRLHPSWSCEPPSPRSWRVQVISPPCEGCTGSGLTQPPTDVDFSPWTRGALGELLYRLAPSVWSWGWASKPAWSLLRPVGRCWLPNHVPVLVLSVSVLPQKMHPSHTQPCARSPALWSSEVPERSNVTWTGFVLLSHQGVLILP